MAAILPQPGRTNARRPPPWWRRPSLEGGARSERNDVLRLRALRALGDLELHALVLVQRAVALGLDGRVVHEDVGAAAVLSDEAEALLSVEPLHRTLCHAVSSVGDVLQPTLCRPDVLSCVPTLELWPWRAEPGNTGCEGGYAATATGQRKKHRTAARTSMPCEARRTRGLDHRNGTARAGERRSARGGARHGLVHRIVTGHQLEHPPRRLRVPSQT